jgi:hypothetical protein
MEAEQNLVMAHDILQQFLGLGREDNFGVRCALF